MMIKLFDWMRLFSNTAHYITLIGETIKDSGSFLVILAANLMLFGIPMSIIDLNREEENRNIQGDFNNWVTNDFINQYNLALGAWDSDNYAAGNQIALIYVFFGLSTFFSIILMLNMLIAIMGDTYEKIIENRDVNEVKTLLGLMGEQSTNIQVFNICQRIIRLGRWDNLRDKHRESHHRGEGGFSRWTWENLKPTIKYNQWMEWWKVGVDDSHNDDFMFLITPDELDESDIESWEGSIKRMNRLSKAHMEEIKESLDTKITSLSDYIELIQRRDAA